MERRNVLRWSAPLVTILSLGASACSPDKKVTVQPSPVSASSLGPAVSLAVNCEAGNDLLDALIGGPDKAGTLEAINTSNCATFYDRDSLQTLGTLDHNQHFRIRCLEGPKPPALLIRLGTTEGDVRLGGNLLLQLNNGGLQQIPDC